VQVCKQLGVDRKHYEPVGVTKLREITRLNSEDLYYNPKTSTNEKMSDHMLQLLADAPEMTADQIEERVKELLGQTGDDEMVWLPAYPAKRSVRDKIILVAQEIARRMLGSAGRDQEGQAVEYSTGAVEEIIHADFIIGNQEPLQENNDGQRTTDATSSTTGDNPVATT
jgi:hypothetical protein